ncbi:hypothetical protein SGPA1_11023 [Streptomyces misionensis JCM 4497]
MSARGAQRADQQQPAPALLPHVRLLQDRPGQLTGRRGVRVVHLDLAAGRRHLHHQLDRPAARGVLHRVGHQLGREQLRRVAVGRLLHLGKGRAHQRAGHRHRRGGVRQRQAPGGRFGGAFVQGESVHGAGCPAFDCRNGTGPATRNGRRASPGAPAPVPDALPGPAPRLARRGALLRARGEAVTLGARAPASPGLSRPRDDSHKQVITSRHSATYGTAAQGGRTS